jgi:hypothetical protein
MALVVGWFWFVVPLELTFPGTLPKPICWALFSLLALPALAFFAIRRRPWMGVTLLAMAVTYGTLAWLPWSPRKAFYIAFDRVQMGMSVAEVEQLFQAHRKRVDIDRESSQFLSSLGPGDPRHQADRLMCLAWTSTDGEADAEVVEIAYRTGRVYWKRSLPD